jgi:hypothetical protein
MRFLSLRGAMPVEGGVPLIKDGKLSALLGSLAARVNKIRNVPKQEQARFRARAAEEGRHENYFSQENS